MTGTPEISVVVATRDREGRLAALLESLRRQTLARDRFEVVVVDDGSSDGTPALLERARGSGPPEVRTVRHERSRGPAAARNAGWRAARAPLIAFTDDDCEADPAWLARSLVAARGAPGAIVQGRTEPLTRELDRRGIFSRTLEVRGLGPYYQTCNIVYPRDLLDRLGGFDETFPKAAGEDTDLAWRALAAGAGAVYADDATVGHAVEDLGPAGMLRLATKWTDIPLVLRRHPGLRREALVYGVFWKRTHLLLALALAGVLLGRRFRPAALLGLPYARALVARCRAEGAPAALAPYLAAYDLLETATVVRGAVRHRVLLV